MYWSEAREAIAALFRPSCDAYHRPGNTFQVWTAAPPGDPTPHEVWQKQAFGRTLQSFRLRQLAVRAVSPEVSIASFVLSETFGQAGKPQTEDSFVVDVWVKNGDDDTWKCTDRYVSAVTGGAHAAGLKKGVRPTGKE